MAAFFYFRHSPLPPCHSRLIQCHSRLDRESHSIVIPGLTGDLTHHTLCHSQLDWESCASHIASLLVLPVSHRRPNRQSHSFRHSQPDWESVTSHTQSFLVLPVSHRRPDRQSHSIIHSVIFNLTPQSFPT